MLQGYLKKDAGVVKYFITCHQFMFWYLMSCVKLTRRQVYWHGNSFSMTHMHTPQLEFQLVKTSHLLTVETIHAHLKTTAQTVRLPISYRSTGWYEDIVPWLPRTFSKHNLPHHCYEDMMDYTGTKCISRLTLVFKCVGCGVYKFYSTIRLFVLSEILISNWIPNLKSL